MSKIVTMHQPNYLPWLGLFSKIRQSDCFVICDNFPSSGNEIMKRNKIRTNTGWGYLTIPVKTYFNDATDTRICDIELPEDSEWRRKHWQAIRYNYLKTPFFHLYEPFFKELYSQEYRYLSLLNEDIIRYLIYSFGLKTQVVRASKLNVSTNLPTTDHVIAIMRNLDADTYLSGPSGRKYLEREKFTDNNITLKFAKFVHPVYKQRYPGFEPSMSAIDLLFNIGPDSIKIIEDSGSIED